MNQVKHIGERVQLNNGIQMPWFGLGVYQSKEGTEVEQAVSTALAAGYRLIDTAAVYGNEAGVGRAIQSSGVSRDELFVTTKVWNSEQGFDTTLRAFEASRERLQLDVIDLYLVHWPVKGKYKETYRALEKLYKEGAVRAIGVSNFQTHHLEDLLGACEIVPTVNQIECHPYLSQAPLRAYCEDKGILPQAWSPLMQGHLDLPILQELAQKYGKTPAQIVLRWDLQHGILTIPKSSNAVRIHENANVFDFELSSEDMSKVDGLNRDERFGADPDNFNF